MATAKTLEDLIASDKAFLTADDVAGVLGSCPHTIRLTAKQRPELLGFPVVVLGNPKDINYARVKIPRIPFLRFMGVRI